MKWIASACCTLLLLGCGGWLPCDDELLALYPGGDMCNVVETLNGQMDGPVPAFLRGEGPLFARGVTLPNGVLNADGSRQTHSWGLWHYYQVDPDEVIVYEDLGREQLVARGEFRDAQRTGPWEFWFPGGAPRGRGSFVDGKMDGEWTVWSTPGVIDAENSGQYVGGIRTP